MQFPDSTLLALDLAADEPSRFGRTLLAALALTAAAVGAAMSIDVSEAGSMAPPSAPPPSVTGHAG